MATNFQNPFNQQPISLTPGRAITRREVYCAPLTNRVVELRWITITVEDQGIYKTEDIKEVVPSLDDGTVPESVTQIRECWRCFSLVTNSYLCPRCGREFCLACTSTLAVDKEGRQMTVCIDCADNIKNPLWHLAKKALWGQKNV